MIACIYLGGAVLTLFAGAWVLGRSIPEFKVAAVKRRKNFLPHTNKDLKVDDILIPGVECFSWILLTVIGAAAWPVAVPMFVMFGSGVRHAKQAKDAERRAAEAEAEIARIKKQEGWV